MFIKKILKVAVLFFVSLIVGCANVETKPYDYAAFRASNPRSIVVIPPLNNSIEADAPYKYLSTITKPLAEKGYYVFPVAVIDQFLKQNGLPTPAEMNTVKLDKIDQFIGADAALYITIEDWGQKYQVMNSAAVVKASLRLVDVKTGNLIWDGKAQAVHAPDNSNAGLAGMLIGALVNQVIGSVVDHTPELASQANTLVVNSKQGLLNGPYLPEKL
jgi:hypothetical protein